MTEEKRLQLDCTFEGYTCHMTIELSSDQKYLIMTTFCGDDIAGISVTLKSLEDAIKELKGE